MQCFIEDKTEINIQLDILRMMSLESKIKPYPQHDKR